MRQGAATPSNPSQALGPGKPADWAWPSLYTILGLRRVTARRPRGELAASLVQLPTHTPLQQYLLGCDKTKAMVVTEWYTKQTLQSQSSRCGW